MELDYTVWLDGDELKGKMSTPRGERGVHRYPCRELGEFNQVAPPIPREFLASVCQRIPECASKGR